MAGSGSVDLPDRPETAAEGVDLVVGGGIIGLAVARELSARTGEPVTVLEKEPQIAAHQTGHNSGVVHAGLYYRPGSLKASLCRRGTAMLEEFCAEHEVPFLRVGKVVVAVTDDERDGLEQVRIRAESNGVPGLRQLDAAGVAEIEPQVRAVAGLHSPNTAITDFPAICRALEGQIRAAGGQVRTGVWVTGLRETASGVRVQARTEAGTDLWNARRVVLCAGLHADRVAVAAGGSPWPRIVPFRGEYLALRPHRRAMVRALVYPVPDPRYPFLGVHATVTVHGQVLLGPNAVLALAREGYRRRDVEFAELRADLTGTHLRAMLREHWRAGAFEALGSLARPVMAHRARRLLPGLRAGDLQPASSGVRAQAVGPRGELLDDFVVLGSGRITAVRNAPSPAATSSLAIAEHLLDTMGPPPARGR
jgi:(S)-2-hydroxyglutarate dehydrogenase